MADMCFELLRRRRLKRWSQADMARHASVGIRTVIRLERGEDVAFTIETLQKLAAALDTDVVTLFPELLNNSAA